MTFETYNKPLVIKRGVRGVTQATRELQEALQASVDSGKPQVWRGAAGVDDATTEKRKVRVRQVASDMKLSASVTVDGKDIAFQASVKTEPSKAGRPKKEAPAPAPEPAAKPAATRRRAAKK